MSIISVYEDQDTIQLKDNLAAKDQQIADLKTQVAALNIASKTSEEQIQGRVNSAVDIAVKQAMENLLIQFSNQHDDKNEKPINELANIIFEG
jgi:hypothetical protein